MSEPDELYTLRAQYWLGHYNLALQEAKSVARRPMSPSLKIEREELMYRSYIALGQYDKIPTSGYDTPSQQAWALKGQYEAAVAIGNESRRVQVIDEIKALAQSQDPNSSAQIAAGQVLLQENQTAAAYSLIAGGMTLEHLATKIQVLLKIDRIDLASTIITQLRQIDEDSIVTQLSSVYVCLAQGRTGASDADHTINALSEQYGASPLLLNLSACALLTAGNYAGAEQKLQECITEHLSGGTDTNASATVAAETLVNLITTLVHQNKVQEAYTTIQQLQTQYPNHPYCSNYERVVSAFDRESIKYKV